MKIYLHIVYCVASVSIVAHADCPKEDLRACPPVREGQPLQLNIRDFGALGQGVGSVCQDTLAIRSAVACIAKNPSGGSVYIPSSSPGFYAFTGDGVFLPDNVTIYGDGDGVHPNRQSGVLSPAVSEIMHVNPASAASFWGVIFYGNSYYPYSNIKQPHFEIESAKKGERVVYLKPVAYASAYLPNLYPQKVIQLGARPTIAARGSDTRRTYFSQIELNAIESLKPLEGGRTKITLKYTLSTDLSAGPVDSDTQLDKSFEHPMLIEVNDNPGITEIPHLGPAKNFVAKNVIIHDLVLNQAQSDITQVPPRPLPTTKDKFPSNVIQGSAFDGRYYNIATKANIGIPGGNMLNRSEYSHISAKVGRKLFDFGFASANLKVHDIDWTYFANAADTHNDEDHSLVYVDSGDHDIEAYNISVQGGWTGKDIFLFTSGANHITFRNWTINLPKQDAPDQAVVAISDMRDLYGARDISLRDISVRLGSVGLVGDFGLRDDKVLEGVERNISLTNFSFKGECRQSPPFQKAPFFGTLNFKNVTVNGEAQTTP